MTKYKININKPLPSEKEIEKSKDFNKFIRSSESLYRPHRWTKDLLKNKKLIRIIVLIIIMIVTLILADHSNPEPNKDTDVIENSGQ